MRKLRKGFSIIDAMIGASILIVIVLGSMLYRYHSVLDSKKADNQRTGVRLAMLLCDAWLGLDGDETFDPTQTFKKQLDISSGTGPDKPDEFTLFGQYEVEVDQHTYNLTLSYNDESTKLRVLNAAVSFPFPSQDNTKDHYVTKYVLKE